MALTEADIARMREQAVIDQIRNEYIEIRLLKKALNWKIDYRDVAKWRKSLATWNEPCVMVDTRTGEILC
jgi:hypothetical protein